MNGKVFSCLIASIAVFSVVQAAIQIYEGPDAYLEVDDTVATAVLFGSSQCPLSSKYETLFEVTASLIKNVKTAIPVTTLVVHCDDSNTMKLTCRNYYNVFKYPILQVLYNGYYYAMPAKRDTAANMAAFITKIAVPYFQRNNNGPSVTLT